MATVHTPLTADTWTLLSAATDFLVQNNTATMLYVTFSGSLPVTALDATPIITVRPGLAVDRGGLTGNIYGLTTSNTNISVSE